jgi:hypothetical protein
MLPNERKESWNIEEKNESSVFPLLLRTTTTLVSPVKQLAYYSIIINRDNCCYVMPHQIMNI